MRGPGRLCPLVLDGPHCARQIVGPLVAKRWVPLGALARGSTPWASRGPEGVEEEFLRRHRLEVWSRSGFVSTRRWAAPPRASRWRCARPQRLVGHDRLPEPGTGDRQRHEVREHDARARVPDVA